MILSGVYIGGRREAKTPLKRDVIPASRTITFYIFSIEQSPIHFHAARGVLAMWFKFILGIFRFSKLSQKIYNNSQPILRQNNRVPRHAEVAYYGFVRPQSKGLCKTINPPVGLYIRMER
jgi:hypothetical protein